jgi:hypothetical protein
MGLVGSSLADRLPAAARRFLADVPATVLACMLLFKDMRCTT